MLDWGRFSLRVPTGRLGELPAALWPIARDAARLHAMQRELSCAWRALFWTSLVGSCFGEDVQGGAARSAAHAATHRVRGSPACSGLLPGPES